MLSARIRVNLRVEIRFRQIFAVIARLFNGKSRYCIAGQLPGASVYLSAALKDSRLGEPLERKSEVRGRSSVVERHVANVNVEGSSPFARFM